MYNDYWKLKAKPFENAPDPRFLTARQIDGELIKKIVADFEREGFEGVEPKTPG